MAQQRILLLGAGHAHLDTLAASARFRAAGAQLTVMAPGPFHYSGLATGVLSGEAPAGSNRVDVAALVRAGGGEFVAGRARAIDVAAGRVLLEDGTALGFELLSLNLGSESAPALPGLEQLALRAKPLEELEQLGRELESRGGAHPRLVVVGAGPTGCELVLCAQRRLARAAGSGHLTLVSGARGLLGPDWPPAARRRMRRTLRRRGVHVAAARAVACERDGPALRGAPGRLVLADGGRVPFDLVLDAGGLRIPSLVAECGLATVDGALHVDQYLRSIDDTRVFAGGDCAAFEGRALARIGVHAVRQGPFLRDNLLASLRGGPLTRYRPQRRALLILNLGDRSGLAVWGGLTFEGRAAWLLKRWLDRRFLARFTADRAPARSVAEQEPIV